MTNKKRTIPQLQFMWNEGNNNIAKQINEQADE
jgi:hypothetical protein